MINKLFSQARYILVPLVAAVPGLAFGELPSRVTAEQAGSKVNAAPSSGMVTRTGQSGTIVRIQNSCFGTNLRNVGNPLAPDAIITASFDIKIGDTPLKLSVRYPSSVATPKGVPNSVNANINPSNITVTDKDGKPISGATAGIHGNVIQVNLPTEARATVAPTGDVKTQYLGKASVQKYTFHQEVVSCSKSAPDIYKSLGYAGYTPVYDCGKYLGKTGPVKANVKGVNVSSDGSSVEFEVAFPGQSGYCGGYYSPLMVFFDERRPEFTQITEFPLNPIGRTHWPEAGHPGYLLAIDVDGDGVISSGEELFGDRDGEKKNGFEALRELDSNGDGVISAKDRDFHRLVLWQDKNGDGVSQKEELIPIKEKGITSISLKYKRVLRPLGRNAEERETAEFTYKVGNKVRKGEVVDIWFAPVPAGERGLASEENSEPKK